MVSHTYKFISGFQNQTTPSQERNSQDSETFLAPFGDKQTRNYDKECSKRHAYRSTISPKELSSSKMKWWAIYKNLQMDVIVRLNHRRIWDIQGQEMFSAPSADKKTRNYDIVCSNHHPSLSTLCEKGLSRSKIKWWAIYTNLPMDVIVRIRHRRRRESQGQKMFLAPSADK